MDDSLLFAIATVIIGLVIAGIARAIVRWLKKFAETTETQWDDIIVAAIGTPVQVGIIAVSVYIALKYFGIVPDQYAWIISDKILNSIYILLGTWIIATLVHDIITIYGHALAEKTEGDWDDRLVELLELAARYIIWFAGIMLILVNLEINITPFLAGAGIAGLAFALAAQDLISNFLGGAIITVDKPFLVGDRVKIDNFYGDVINIGPRSTRLKTLDYQIVTIPNNKITSTYIVNYSEPDVKLRITIPVSVAYGSDPVKVKALLLEIAHDVIERTDYLHKDPAPTAFFLEFADSSLKFILYVWARKYNLPDDVKDAINTRIAGRFAAEGIDIPFPQMEVRLKK
ncbi:MAG: mechanosensitive ion channel family protein [Methanoregula sp.]|jgi:small-conductance mechanosensitive channel|uniref:mechanosensitive ion channel family protein n=1 Tax=Methanoregula sp. TaxID=2052170 RepID=UPI003C296A1F